MKMEVQAIYVSPNPQLKIGGLEREFKDLSNSSGFHTEIFHNPVYSFHHKNYYFCTMNSYKNHHAISIYNHQLNRKSHWHPLSLSKTEYRSQIIVMEIFLRKSDYMINVSKTVWSPLKIQGT